MRGSRRASGTNEQCTDACNAECATRNANGPDSHSESQCCTFTLAVLPHHHCKHQIVSQTLLRAFWRRTKHHGQREEHRALVARDRRREFPARHFQKRRCPRVEGRQADLANSSVIRNRGNMLPPRRHRRMRSSDARQLRGAMANVAARDERPPRRRDHGSDKTRQM